jgi:uncharacterized protein DUF6636
MVLRLTLLALAAALLAPAGAASATFRDFRSPSGKLGCAFFRDVGTPRTVRCDWQGSDDEAVVLKVRGKAHVVHVTDTVMNPDAPVLAYGHTKRFGKLRCKSLMTGIRCRSRRSGHGFKVSVEKRRLF